MADYLLHGRIIDAAVSDERRAVHIWGGKGTGKSHVLDLIARKLKAEGARVVRGRDADASALRTALESGSPVLVDDLEAIFTREVYELLCEYREPSQRLIFTSAVPPDVTLLVDTRVYETLPEISLRDWSDITLQFHPEEIDPWPPNWRFRIASFVRDAVSADYREDPVFVAEWTTSIIHLTGGHPLLLETALNEVTRAFGSSGSADALLATPARNSSERRRRNYAHLEHLLFSSIAFRRLRHVIREINASAPSASEFLTNKAKGEDVEFDAPVEFARFLTDSAIVRRNPRSHRLAINGELVRRLLANSGSRLPHVIFSASTELPEERGTVIAEIGGEQTYVELRGAAWRVARQLDAHREQIVPVQQLTNAAKVDHAGARSAIQRLKSELAEAGIDGLIENVWGQGYQMSEFPLVTISEE